MQFKPVILLIVILGLAQSGFSQTHLKLGAGYYGEAITRPGIVLDFEIEKMQTESISFPLRANLGAFTSSDYSVIFLDLHKGLRKSFDSGLFLEQAIGFGLMATDYQVEGIFYNDQFGNIMRPYPNFNLSIMPSVEVGVGYTFAEGKYAIWIRPKIYWNLGFRDLALPYGALQIGFTHTFKTN